MSPAWASGPGRGKDVRWPVGIGGKGNEGVAAFVQRLPNSIGYVEYAYVKQNKMTYTLLRNKDGQFVAPDDTAFKAAAAVENTTEAPRASRPKHHPLKLLWELIVAFPRMLMLPDSRTSFKHPLTGQRGTEELGGPLRIAQLSGQVAGIGFVSLISFIAVLSVNLGLINLFPIPVLDGGHLAWYAIETIKGSPVSEAVQSAGQRVGLAVLLMMMGLAFYNDLARLFGP